MKKIIVLLALVVSISGCATVRKEYSKNIAQMIHVGMTKEQVYRVNGPSTTWSRQTINGHIYETWIYIGIRNTFDFVDNSLTGYSLGLGGGAYYSKDNVEDVRNYK